MKRLAVGVLAILLGSVSPAFAVDFSLQTFTVNLNSSGPGLNVWSIDETGSLVDIPYDFSLSQGQSRTVSLFAIGTDENYIDDDDWKPYGINVNFAFDLPAEASGNVWGITGGGYFGRYIGELGYVAWDNPLNISFGSAGTLAISLSHEKFGVPGYAIVEATFKLNAPGTTPTSVPEPSSLALLGIGAGAALTRRRRLEA